eukprot:CAMPEP_0202007794 /NCGR_PEP_ID=MMETSP0905-20130828/12176_1 /ASSEMBLY_ACC=CAM_ASM_000554 /TAXON_ID=420261 /ORGANISM="Thalassiosira antarctica, Strain CCMP982" /LENGTH=133 /DNA_ID=CAMNT_0048565807 /DNA_START=349 /DNA_END=751 /DNA_ORIENTATION=+
MKLDILILLLAGLSASAGYTLRGHDETMIAERVLSSGGLMGLGPLAPVHPAHPTPTPIPIPTHTPTPTAVVGAAAARAAAAAAEVVPEVAEAEARAEKAAAKAAAADVLGGWFSSASKKLRLCDNLSRFKHIQ